MQKIITDPNICHGKAHIVGTRVPVHVILGLLAAGDTHKNILNAYPHLTEEDIMACIEYAAKIASEEVLYESEAT